MKKLLILPLLFLGVQAFAQLSETPIQHKPKTPLGFVVFPNPVKVGEFTSVYIAGVDNFKFDFVLHDLRGNAISEWHARDIKQYRFNLNQQGIYLANVKITLLDGRVFRFQRKVFVR